MSRNLQKRLKHLECWNESSSKPFIFQKSPLVVPDKIPVDYKFSKIKPKGTLKSGDMELKTSFQFLSDWFCEARSSPWDRDSFSLDLLGASQTCRSLGILLNHVFDSVFVLWIKEWSWDSASLSSQVMMGLSTQWRFVEPAVRPDN